MKTIRRLIGTLLIHLGAKIYHDDLWLVEHYLGHIEWESWEWDHDKGFDRDTREYKIADAKMRELHQKAQDGRMILNKFR